MDTLYLKHDTDSRDDERIIRLIRIKGLAGYGMFWVINEFLFKHNGRMPVTSMADIAYSIRVEEAVIKDIIEGYGLYKIKNGHFFSKRLLRDIEIIEAKSKRSKDAVNKRWDKYRQDALVLLENNDGNTKREEDTKQDISKYFSMAVSDKIWKDIIIQKHKAKISEANFEHKLNEFILNLKATKENKNNYKEFCSHFSNWLGTKKPESGGSKLQTTLR